MEEKSVGRAILQIYKEIDDLVDKKLHEDGVIPTCKKGCSHCCYEHVDVWYPELAPIIEALNEMPIEQQKRLGERGIAYLKAREGTDLLNVLETLEQAEEKGMAKEMTIEQENSWNSNKRTLAVRHRRLAWETNTPCPFLEDNACSIYEARPHHCRGMFSEVQDPKAETYRNGEAEVIRTDGVPFTKVLTKFAGPDPHRVMLPMGSFIGVLLKHAGKDVFDKLLTNEEEEECT